MSACRNVGMSLTKLWTRLVDVVLVSSSGVSSSSSLGARLTTVASTSVGVLAW
jgi:hypothetical protein